jgi:hypothetical protein
VNRNSLSQAIPDIPPELSTPLPRRIRLSTGTQFTLIVCVLVIGLTVVVGGWFCKYVVHQMEQRSDLRQNGAEVQGEITFLKRVGRGSDVVRYTFNQNGETVSGNAQVPPELMQKLRESNFIAVKYLPSNPAINHPAAWEWSLLSNWPAIFVLMVYLPVGVFPLRIYRQRRLLAWGKPVVGVVTKCAPVKGTFSIEYEFHAENGIPVNGSGYSRIRQEIGANVWVLFMPQKPGRNLTYPVPGYVVEQ